MKKKFLGKVLMMASFVAILGGFSSCKDYSEDRYSDLLGKLENQNISLEEALEDQKKNLMDKIAELQAAQDACKKECAEKMSQLETNWNNQLAAQLAHLLAEDAKLQEQINGINEVMGVVDTTKGTVAEQLVALNHFADSVVGWGPRLTAVEKAASEASLQANANKAAIENLDSIAAAHGVSLDSIFGNLEVVAAELEAVKEQAAENLDSAKAYADDQVAALKDSVIASVTQLYEMMDSVDAVMGVRLDSLEARVDSLEAQVNKNTKDIEVLTGRLNKLVTSVIIQGTKNPVMGSIATPFNTRSNILAAYYGHVGSAGLNFPTVLPRFYVNNADVKMTSKDLEMLGVEAIEHTEGELLTAETGNAGTLYMTINPNTVDFEGLQFELVNSQDEPSGVVFDGVVASDEVLTFGYTRAANNGFYEAQATIPADKIEELRFTLNFNEIKDVVKDIVNRNIDISKIAKTVANTMESFVMDANGIKVSWTDSVGEHSTYSQYGVAVTSVKPLSYTFGKDFNYTKVPGMDRLENFVGQVTQKAKNVIAKADKVLNIELVEIKEISMPEYTGKDSLDVVINIPAQNAYDNNGNIIGTTDAYVDTIKVGIVDVIDELYAGMEDSFSDVNAMLNDLQGMMDEINDIIQTGKNLQASANNAVDKIQSKFSSFLTKFNNGFCKIINSANKAIRPVMFISTTDDFHKLSEAKNNPTVITGTELEFIASSYTQEFLAPSYKKLVGVTNVFKGSASAQGGDDACKAVLDYVNDQDGMAEILPGHTYLVSATFEPGYVYEIVYTAVDFFGMVDAKKYYVTVK